MPTKGEVMATTFGSSVFPAFGAASAGVGGGGGMLPGAGAAIDEARIGVTT